MKKAITGRKEEQQHIIVTENNLFKGFTSEDVRNYDQKLSGKLGSGVAWKYSRCGRFLAGKFAAPSAVAVKLAGFFWSQFQTPSEVKPLNKLFSVTIMSCCSSVSSCCFFPSVSFNHNSQRRHLQLYIPMRFRVLFASLILLGSLLVCL